MALTPLSSSQSPMVGYIADLKDQMDGLSRQLATGRKADTFGGLGRDRALALGFRQQRAQIQSYGSTTELVSVRLTAIATTLDRVGALGREATSALSPNQFVVLGDGATGSQKAARNYLDELAALLNGDVAGRYIFSGKESDTRPVEKIDTILDGDGTRDGLRQILAERRQADLGTAGLGRLTVAPAGPATVTVSEEAAGLPFGFTLDVATSQLSGATVTLAGSPKVLTVAFAGQPQPGERLDLTLGLPDGSTTSIRLTASSSPDQPGEFDPGSTPAEAATNLQAALSTALAASAETALAAASGLQAAREFFASGPAAQALRVDGPPFDTATGLRAATGSDTISWYRGSNDSGAARDDAVARIDREISVAYGLRANEAPFAAIMAELAAFVADDFSAATDADSSRSSEMITRMRVVLHANGDEAVAAVQMEFAGTHRSINQAAERHRVAESNLTTLVESVEGADPSDVSVKLMAVQTRLQASYQAAAMIYRLSLTDYL